MESHQPIQKVNLLILANVFFWITFALFDILSTGGTLNGYYSVASIRFLLHAFLFALLIYPNLYVLYPRFFSEKRYISYSFFSFVLIVLVFYLRVSLDDFLLHSTNSKGIFGDYYNQITAEKAIQNFTDARFYQNDSGFQYPYYVGMAIGTIGVFFITTPLKLVEDWYNKKQLEIKLLQNELKQQQAANRIREEKLKFLKAQTDPHFLINAITGVYHLELIESNQVDYALLRLSELMGYILGHGKQDFIALKHEIQFIENYINFNNTIHLNEFDVQFHHNASKQQLEAIQIPPMLLQPFFENAYKYSGSDHDTPMISSKLEVEPQCIRFFIENTLSSTEMSRIKKPSHGIGIKNVQERLQLFFPKKHSLIAGTKDHSFRIELIIHL